MNTNKLFRKPSFTKIFFCTLLKVTAIAALLLCVALWVIDRVYVSAEKEKAEGNISELREEIITDIRDYYSGSRLLRDKRCELRRKLLDLWETNHIAVCIKIDKEIPIDASQCLMMKCYRSNNEYDMFLDDYSYKEMNEYWDVILKYSHDSSCIIQVNDAYINWEKRSFYPGQICVVDRVTHKLIQSVDLTPSDDLLLRDYQKVHGYNYGSEWEPMSIRIVGIEDISSLHYEYTEEIVVKNVRKDVPIIIRKTVVDDRDILVSRISKFIPLIGIMVLGIDLLLSLFISLIVFYKEKNMYEIIDYRRKTTDAMAHDLKTPLAITYIYYEKLKDAKDSEKADSYFEQMKKSLDYMNELINGILIFSKTQYSNIDVSKESVNIRKNFELILSDLSPAMSNRDLTYVLKGDANHKVNTVLWNQAIGNLLTNAINYASSDSLIEINLGNDEIVIKNKIDATIDNPNELIKPFVKGNSVRGENSGSGLGLAVASENLSRMGYVLTVESIDKTFMVRIKKKSSKKMMHKLFSFAFVGLLVLVQIFSFRAFAKREKVVNNPLLQSRYEFLLEPLNEEQFYQMINGLPNELQNCDDIQIRSQVHAVSNNNDAIDFVVAAYYPNIYEGREIYSYGTNNPRELKDREIIITKQFGERIAPFYGRNDAIYINGGTYNVWGEAIVVDESVDNSATTPNCWVNAYTFFKLSDTYNQVVFQYDEPLDEETLDIIKSYMFEDVGATSYIGPHGLKSNSYLAWDIALLIFINLLIIGCYVWIGCRYKRNK